MGKIKDYAQAEFLDGSEIFVAETSEGTKSIPIDLFEDFIKTEIDTKANSMTGFDVEVVSNTEEEYILRLNIGETSITTPNLKQTTIKSASIKGGHLVITMTDGSEIDAGLVMDVPEYGVCRDINSHSPELTRMANSVGLEAYAGVGDANVRNDFDNIYPWSEMRKCVLSSDGKVVAYEGEVGYAEDGAAGQVMVEIPKFYLKHYVDDINGKEYWYISAAAVDSDYRLPQAFIAKDGSEIDKIYIAAYMCSDAIDTTGKADSRAGNVYSYPITYNEAITGAAAIGRNWHCVDIAELTEVIHPLFIIEFATLNSQSVMYGCCNIDVNERNPIVYICENHCWGDSAEEINEITGNYFYSDQGGLIFVGQEISISTDEDSATGELDTGTSAVRKITAIDVLHEDWGIKVTFDGPPIKMIKNSSFSVNYGRNGITNSVKAFSGSVVGLPGIAQMKYRGIEDLYGLDYTWVQGILHKSGSFYASLDINNIGTDITDEYVQLNIPFVQTRGYISKMGIDERYPWASVPVAGDGSSSEDFCDGAYQMVSNTIIRAMAFGGNTKDLSGLFSSSLARDVLSSSSYYFMRLSFRKYE